MDDVTMRMVWDVEQEAEGRQQLQQARFGWFGSDRCGGDG